MKDDAQDLVGLIAAEVNVSRSNDESDEWILETGCSFHMTPRKELFIELRESTLGRVRIANNSFTEVKGIGSTRFHNLDERRLFYMMSGT